MAVLSKRLWHSVAQPVACFPRRSIRGAVPFLGSQTLAAPAPPHVPWSPSPSPRRLARSVAERRGRIEAGSPGIGNVFFWFMDVQDLWSMDIICIIYIIIYIYILMLYSCYYINAILMLVYICLYYILYLCYIIVIILDING